LLVPGSHRRERALRVHHAAGRRVSGRVAHAAVRTRESQAHGPVRSRQPHGGAWHAGGCGGRPIRRAAGVVSLDADTVPGLGPALKEAPMAAKAVKRGMKAYVLI